MYHKNGKMTGREFLQFFGSEICRRIYEEIWVSRLIKDVESEGSLLAVIDDCRYPNEAEAIQNAGGKVIRLTRSNYKDSHKSENGFDKDYEFDAVIDNQNMTIQETHVEIMKAIEEWGWLGAPITPDTEPASQVKEEPVVVGGIHQFRESE
jgi:ribosome-binding protein aMBF1 (putative translation factor)